MKLNLVAYTEFCFDTETISLASLPQSYCITNPPVQYSSNSKSLRFSPSIKVMHLLSNLAAWKLYLTYHLEEMILFKSNMIVDIGMGSSDIQHYRHLSFDNPTVLLLSKHICKHLTLSCSTLRL